jgi:replicative DNA helicase
MKPLPSDVSTERAFLSCLLVDARLIADAMTELEVEDMFHPAHQFIYQAMIDLYRNGEVPDLVLLCSFLEKVKKLQMIGGPVGLARLLSEDATAQGFRGYTKILKDLAVRRELIKESLAIVESATEGGDTVEGLIDQAQGAIISVARKAQSTDRMEHISTIMPAVVEKIRAAEQDGGPVLGISTGYQEIDRILCGWQRQDLVIVAARPSMGKTAFAVCACIEAAKAGHMPVFFSLEMSKEQIGMRLVAALSGQDMQGLRKGTKKGRSEWESILTASEDLVRRSIYVDDTPSITPLQIRTRAQRLLMAGRCDLVIVDYIQICKSSERQQSREVEVSSISRDLKAIAKSLDVPVIALAQLNRKLEERADKRPKLSDLRESGAVEQDADVVSFLYREAVYKEGADPTQAEFIIGKQRNGPTGTASLTWDAPSARFKDGYVAQKTRRPDAGRALECYERPSWYDKQEI